MLFINDPKRREHKSKEPETSLNFGETWRKKDFSLLVVRLCRRIFSSMLSCCRCFTFFLPVGLTPGFFFLLTIDSQIFVDLVDVDIWLKERQLYFHVLQVCYWLKKNLTSWVMGKRERGTVCMRERKKFELERERERKWESVSKLEMKKLHKRV